MAGVIAIGECMAELSLIAPGSAAIGYAGDTYNTAVYLRRLGLEVAYASAVGQGDPFSAGILASLADEGIGRGLVVEADGRLPGLYAIQRDAKGERSFFFWRSEAPARDYLKLVDLAALGAALKAADLIVVSAISLASMASSSCRESGLRLLTSTKDPSGLRLLNSQKWTWPPSSAGPQPSGRMPVKVQLISTASACG